MNHIDITLQGQEFFSSPQRPDGGYPVSCTMDTEGHVTLHEADHSRPSSVEVKNTWSFTSISVLSSWPGA
jgi:hypothetical protein